MSSLVLNYVGLIIGAMSILATIFYAVKYAERKQPSLHSISQSKISISIDAPQSIEVHYEGKKVPRVSSTIVRFWNAGRRPIKRDDVPANQPLLLKLKDSAGEITILDVNVLKTSRQATNFQAIKNDPSTVRLEFDFLDENDGAAIEIQHTGTWRATIEPTGVILGASKGIKIVSSRISGLMPGLDNIISLPFSEKQYRQRKLFARLLASILLIGSISGLIWFFRGTLAEITTTPKLLEEALSRHMAREQLVVVIDAIQKSAKYKFLSKVVPYAFLTFLFIILVFGLIVVWRRRFPFPDSLLVKNTPTVTASKSTEKVPSA